MAEILLGCPEEALRSTIVFSGLIFVDYGGDSTAEMRPTQDAGKGPIAPKGSWKGKHPHVGVSSLGRRGGPPAQPRAFSLGKGCGKRGRGKDREHSSEGKGKDKSRTPRGDKGNKGDGKRKSASPQQAARPGAPKGGKPTTPGQLIDMNQATRQSKQQPAGQDPDLGQMVGAQPVVYSSGAVAPGSAATREASRPLDPPGNHRRLRYCCSRDSEVESAEFVRRRSGARDRLGWPGSDHS